MYSPDDAYYYSHGGHAAGSYYGHPSYQHSRSYLVGTQHTDAHCTKNKGRARTTTMVTTMTTTIMMILITTMDMTTTILITIPLAIAIITPTTAEAVTIMTPTRITMHQKRIR